jgi:hypothetical protein
VVVVVTWSVLVAAGAVRVVVVRFVTRGLADDRRAVDRCSVVTVVSTCVGATAAAARAAAASAAELAAACCAGA